LEDRRLLTTFFWDGDSDTDGDGISWNDPLNWTADSGFPNDTADQAEFAGFDVGPVNVNGAFTVGALTMLNTSDSYSFAAAGAANSLTIDNGSGGGTVTQIGGVSASFNDGLILPNPTDVFVADAAGVLTINASSADDVLTGAGLISKLGFGTLVLSGTVGNTLAGGVDVQSGQLVVDNAAGSATGAGPVILGTGTVLAGGGAVSGPVTANAGSTILPGSLLGGAADLGTGNLAMSAGAVYSATINGITPDTQHDQLDVTGSVSLGGATLLLSGTLAATPATAQTIVLIDNDGADAVTGTFLGLADGATVAGPGGGTFFISYSGGDGNDVVLTSQPLINGTPGDDVFTLIRSGANVTLTFGATTLPILDLVSPLMINGGAGNDRLIVDYTGGDPVPTGGLVFDGGPPAAAPGDGLSIKAGGAGSILVKPNSSTGDPNAKSGTIKVGASGEITFRNIEPIDLNALGMPVVIAPTGAADVIALDDGLDFFDVLAIPAIRVSGTSGGGAFETIAVFNTPLLTIDTVAGGSDGADTVTLNTVTGGLATVGSLKVDTGAGADAINVNGVADFTAGTVELDAGTGGSITDPAPATPGIITTTLTATAGTGITLGTNVNSLAASATAGNVTITEANAIDLGATTVSGTLTVTANGAITDSGPLLITGTTTLAAGAANNITLDEATNNFSTVVVNTANNVTLNDAGAIDLGAMTVAGNLIVTANGAITDSGPLSVAGTTTLTAGAANNITLDQLANNFVGAVSVITANNVTLNDANAIDLGPMTVSGNLSVTANGAITDSGQLSVD
jgi:hypothetical protein